MRPAISMAFLTWVGEIPVVVINQNDSVERRRFTGLHELGHLVLDFGELEESELEKRCHQFAGAMILPAKVIKSELGEYRTFVSFGELVALKEKYGISVQAAMSRAKQLEIINAYTFKVFCMSIASNRREENLGSFKGEEKSYRFENLLFRLVSEDLVSISKAANLGNMKVAEFRDKLDAIILMTHRIAINDATILIDLVKTGLFEASLKLPIVYHTTNIIFEELHDFQRAFLVSLSSKRNTELLILLLTKWLRFMN
ncbi:MAG: ImmA/IrrE family metallo-endopeptidase [Spirosomataceae bacterium]